DFGLAKERWPDGAGGSSQITLPNHAVGTPAYMSPEAIRGDDAEIEVRSDIYSLGAVLYELVTGAFPYDVFVGLHELRPHILEQPALRPSEAYAECPTPPHGDGISRDLDTILLKALDKDKSRRYQSATALADDLERFLDGRAIAARADSRWYVLGKTLSQF